jgi:GntR family transcriptional regulator
MAIWFDIDPKNGAPIFKQVIEQVKRAVATGMLKPDERLPTVRELAEEHSINPNTIAKAYQNLELLGLVYTRPGVRGGTFIAQFNEDILREAELTRYQEELQRLVREGYNLRLEAPELTLRFQSEVEAWYTTHPPLGMTESGEIAVNSVSSKLEDRGAKKL